LRIDKIKTTFKNTITPAETVNALQTMITLPLIRPQLFSQGLLQNEFLSGLLLFGPPGTGKTLLAKAVAKESGARMLEIKASDIFDMYVGEGEKNVSAVFSLARKLSPCVIFLDEVDSIFRARSLGGAGGGGSGGHSSQREILNQFMVEWDGLRSSGQNNGIVVMASTNRPFELDDAVLRRLPRRILVDLPSEQAREKILNVYLGQETLDVGIDVKELAKKTALFSGSDLKNLCVSAALASVREVVEGEVKALQGGDVAEVFVSDASSLAVSGDKDKDTKEKDKVLDLSPLLNQYKQEALAKITATAAVASPAEATTATRVIHKRHFDRALAQITPSCSENMESLTELRKWDGLYGDGGKGRRKAIKSLGFDVDPGTGNNTTKHL
jgi:SpoVK/Ycf46/Vps4 family AAA+-type ATPase